MSISTVGIQTVTQMEGLWGVSGTEARMRTFSIQQIKVPGKKNSEKTGGAILEVMIAQNSSKWWKTCKHIRCTWYIKQNKFLKAAPKQTY